MDIHIDVPRVDYDELTGDRLGESSAKIRDRVERARARQRQRLAGVEDSKGSPPQANGDMGPVEVRQFCELSDTGKALLRSAMP